MNRDFTGASQDYARIAQIITLIRNRATTQPGPAGLAAAAGLSEGHLQRLFGRWAGISPKRFLQVLSLSAAKARLRQTHREDVLSVAINTGLSGPGRLHDLFVNLTSTSRADYANGGATVQMRHGTAETPFGRAFFAWTERSLAALEFIESASADAAEAACVRLRAGWPEALLIADAAGAAQWPGRVFPHDAAGPERGLSLCVRGTNFQVQVWQALLRIPPGAATSYGALATELGRPGAARAVGGAVGANPVSWLIPCHRVLRADGATGGYRWGVERKLAMLAREAPPVNDGELS